MSAWTDSRDNVVAGMKSAGLGLLEWARDMWDLMPAEARGWCYGFASGVLTLALILALA